MIMVYSSEPTKPTSDSGRATHALLEWIEFNRDKIGALILPDCLLGLNHRGIEITLSQSKKIKLTDQT